VDIYQEKGYRDREHYLRSVADEYSIHYQLVLSIAENLGPKEDFNGLIIEIWDKKEIGDYEEDNDDDDWEDW